MKNLDHLNLPLILMMDAKVCEVGRIDIHADWKFDGWISTEVADALKLETNLGSIALNPVSDYIVMDQEHMLDALREYHDDQTLIKVREAISSSCGTSGYGDDPTDDIINALQNAGILFRERKN